MDAQTLRRALADFFRFNPKDFFVQGSGTGLLVSAVRRSASAVSEPCELKAIDASEGSSLKVSVLWGRINGRTPDNFNSEGLITAFDISETCYLYAKATINTAMQWVSSEVVQLTDPDEPNTSTTAFRIIAAITFVPGSPDTIIVNPTCGPVDFDVCELDTFA